MLDGPRIESWWGRDLHCLSDWPRGPPNFLYNGYWVYPGSKVSRTWRWPPISQYRVANGLGLCLSLPCMPTCAYHGTILSPLHKIINISGSLEPTFKRCCVLGSNWAAEDLKCNNFPAPVAGVSPEQQSVCLSAVEICCLRKHRWVRFQVLATVSEKYRFQPWRWRHYVSLERK